MRDVFSLIWLALIGLFRSRASLRSDRVVALQIGLFAELPPERRLDAINEHLKQDPARVQLAAWFDSNRRKSRVTWKSAIRSQGR